MIALVSAALVLTLLGVIIVPTAFARIVKNTIDPIALVTDEGRHVIVTGPIAIFCADPSVNQLMNR